MDFGAWVLIFEFFLFIMAVPATFLIIKRLTEQTKTSDTVVINRDGGKTNMNVLGNLVSKETGKKGRLIIKYMSRDSREPEMITVLAEPNKVISYPKGVWSGQRNIIEILPNNAQDYINNLLTTIEEKSADTHIKNAQKEGLNRQASHLLDIGEGEISDLNLGLAKDFENKLLKSQSKDDGKRGSSSYPSSSDFKN